MGDASEEVSLVTASFLRALYYIKLSVRVPLCPGAWLYCFCFFDKLHE